MADQPFHLSGFVPMPMSGPCFATPVFTGPTNAPWLQDFRADDRIEAFLAIDAGDDPRVRTADSKLVRRVGDQALFGFRLPSTEPIFGTRDELIIPLTECFTGLEDRPNTQRAIANFLRSEELLALVEPKPKAARPRPSPPRRRGPNILVISSFGTDQRPFFEAAVFTVLACGAQPATVLDHADSGLTRLDLIKRMSSTAAGLICVLETGSGDEPSPAPRNNLVFELGLYLGMSSSKRRRADPLILSDEPFSYQSTFSNLAGMNVVAHRGKVDKVVRSVRDYLVRNTDAKAKVGAAIAREYNEFLRELLSIRTRLSLGPNEPTMGEFRQLATAYLDER